MSWHWLLFWVSSCACNTPGSSIFCSAANFTGAFSSQVESLGGSENATKQRFSAYPVKERERERL
jgi:hypothetical protein